MKNFFFVVVLLCSTLAFSQVSTPLGDFEAVDSSIDATLHIMKSEQHKIEISGDSRMAGNVSFDIKGNRLIIGSKGNSEGYKDVVVTVYTPSIGILEMTAGGRATLDSKFSRMESFEVSATNGATVDLTNIEFRSLVAQSSNGGQVLYRSASKLIKKAEEGGKVRSIQ